MSANTETLQTYRIGTVARLTGISPDTLRVWERRYGVVEPTRSAGGDREYSRLDIERLQLLKRLVDRGEAIGTVAGLDTETLTERVAEGLAQFAPGEPDSQLPCRIMVVGETLPQLLVSGGEAREGLEVIAASTTVEQCLSKQADGKVDVLVLEIATVHSDTTRQIVSWLEQTGAQKALVVYRFAASDALQRLPAARIQTIRAPVTPLVVRNLCLGMLPRAKPGNVNPAENGADLSVAARRFSNAELAMLAQQSPTVKCECPKHLAELITDLVAFERYSSECENLNREDAALHAYLHATASQARDLIENALSHVIEVEGIQLQG